MCGIAGFTHRICVPGPIRRECGKRPNAFVIADPISRAPMNRDMVSLGAVRLKIIDLHGGEQPMRSDDGDR